MMQRLSVTQKLLLSYTILILGIAFLMGIYILPTELKTLSSHLESTISQTATLLSEDSSIKTQVECGQFDQTLIKRLDQMKTFSKDIDYVVIADTNSTRLYHPNHAQIGKKFAGNDEGDILNGASPYITVRKGNTDVQKRAFHSITDSSGKIIGFLMVSASMSTIRHQQETIVFQFFLIFLLVLTVGFLLAWLLSKNIRKALLGFEPGTFAKMYLQREEILDNLDEGILICDKNGQFRYRNESALRIFTEDHLSSYEELLPFVETCRTMLTAQFRKMVTVDDTSLIASFLPFSSPDQVGSVLIIIRDRTELVTLTEQLTGSNHIVDALRANTHEYMNRLHVILGLLQIEAYDEAISFISDVSSDIKNGYQTIVRQIKNKTIAALILGKYNRAKELNVDLCLRNDSHLEEHDAYLSTKELVTIIGNLLENAFEALEHLEKSRYVELFIGSDSHGLTITVDDTGCGMTEEQIAKIYQSQYTTKGEGHGFGLRLIQEIIHKHHGYLDIESEPDVGTSFTINISEKRNGYD